MKHAIAGLVAAFLGLASPAMAQRVVPPDDTVNCAFNTSPPTVTTGQMVRIQCDAQGRLLLSPTGGGTIVEGNVSNASSGVATSSTNVPSVSYNYWWNGTTWDQAPGNMANGGFVQGSVASGVADAGNPIKIGGVFNTTPPTLTNAQRSDAQSFQNGALAAVISGTNAGGTLVAINGTNTNTDGLATSSTASSLRTGSFSFQFNGTTWDRQRGTATNGTFVSPGGFSFSHITTAATTTTKSGAGSVHTICVNSLGTVASTVTVYDNTAGSGTVIAVINSLTLLGCQTYDAAFATGLTLVTTGTVAPDVTVTYR